MIVIDSDGYVKNYVLISSSHCIIFKKISALKNTLFLVKLVPWRWQSSGDTYEKQETRFFYFPHLYHIKKIRVTETRNPETRILPNGVNKGSWIWSCRIGIHAITVYCDHTFCRQFIFFTVANSIFISTCYSVYIYFDRCHHYFKLSNILGEHSESGVWDSKFEERKSVPLSLTIYYLLRYALQDIFSRCKIFFQDARYFFKKR